LSCGRDPHIYQKREAIFEKMDCRVKPGNDERTSEPAFADRHGIAPPPLSEKNKAITR